MSDITHESVSVQHDRVVISHLEVSRPQVVAFVNHEPDQVEAVRRAVEMGAEVLSIAQSTLDSQLVAKAFDGLKEQLGSGVDSALGRLGNALTENLSLFADERLTKVLDLHRKRIEDELNAVFGPASARSVQKQIELMLKEQSQFEQNRLKELLTSVDDPTNPLALLRRELTNQVKQVETSVHDLANTMAAAAATSKEHLKTTAKGVEFEEVVYQQLLEMAAVNGDVVERVGRLEGNRKANVGDIVITLSEQHTGGEQLRIVLEIKDQPARSSRFSITGIRSELSQAMANRDAVVGMFVTSSAEVLPIGLLPVVDVGAGMVATFLSQDAGFPYGLAFAYRLLRCEALGTLANRERQVNEVAIRAALKRAGDSIQRLAQAKGGINKAIRELNTVDRSLDEVETEIRKQLAIVDANFSNTGVQFETAA